MGESLADVSGQPCRDVVSRLTGALNLRWNNQLSFRRTGGKLNVAFNGLNDRSCTLLASPPAGQTLAEVNCTLGTHTFAT
jgi:hypothetical protein